MCDRQHSNCGTFHSFCGGLCTLARIIRVCQSEMGSIPGRVEPHLSRSSSRLPVSGRNVTSRHLLLGIWTKERPKVRVAPTGLFGSMPIIKIQSLILHGVLVKIIGSTPKHTIVKPVPGLGLYGRLKTDDGSLVYDVVSVDEDYATDRLPQADTGELVA
ncbi:hypothetical protein BCR34DRAFT_98924 [Clohesyomyces aquaticus]|uniref:Uncharacterized protein n=1 Tax=Clohesyomyces aquaticus TaxID=1231657 RepID=A0A1Y1YTM2_9PLEO|nr:hypothetical protein BCR34DRAFT_98924 [Clohesyomyces aquaticus]